ncbi:hypothetical protein [Novosphingobium sp. PY1]|uniref:hypothetical protein n=1 Tax=Novosphingobium sp. PY1 TaxID=1882221 RepID=UPI001A8D8977|nr:hypothetical protein [Novosphingobium sp. PY1]GFM29657.1 uncharacterized protein PY1_contig-08-236 [Novosphingobium sp. PY1]
MGVTLQFTRMEPFGVEILSDLSRAFGPSEAFHLRDLFGNHGVILARSAALSQERRDELLGLLGDKARLSPAGPAQFTNADGVVLELVSQAVDFLVWDEATLTAS